MGRVNESQKGGQEGQTTLVTDGGSGEKKSKGWGLNALIFLTSLRLRTTRCACLHVTLFFFSLRHVHNPFQVCSMDTYK